MLEEEAEPPALRKADGSSEWCTRRPLGFLRVRSMVGFSSPVPRRLATVAGFFADCCMSDFGGAPVTQGPRQGHKESLTRGEKRSTFAGVPAAVLAGMASAQFSSLVSVLGLRAAAGRAETAATGACDSSQDDDCMSQQGRWWVSTHFSVSFVVSLSDSSLSGHPPPDRWSPVAAAPPPPLLGVSSAFPIVRPVALLLLVLAVLHPLSATAWPLPLLP